MSYVQQTAFSREEYDARVRRTREHMQERGVDVLLVDQTEFIAYLTGFSVSENMYRACLLPLEGDPVVVLRAVDLGPFIEGSWLGTDQAVPFADWENPLEVLVRTAHSKGWDGMRIGIDEDSYCMPVRRFRQLQALMPSARFVDFSGVLEILRASKSPQEIAYMRQASRVADIALQEALATLVPGKTDRDAAAAVHDAFMRHGAETSRAGIITAGEGNSFLHGGLHGRTLKAGDVLHMEILPLVQGYSARLMRPAVVGSDSKRAALARQLVDIQDRQFAAMKPGARAGDIDRIAREAVLAAGLRPDYLNITGYTIGYFPLSTPHTSDFSRVFLPSETWELQPGMTFHMYLSAAGVAFSETVLVTDSGIELLTQSPRQLFEI